MNILCPVPTVERNGLLFSKILNLTIPARIRLRLQQFMFVPGAAALSLTGRKKKWCRQAIGNPFGKEDRRRIAFRINAFYSPWLSFGDIAYKFVKKP